MRVSARNRVKTIESVLRMVCAVLMLSLGFAHKPVQAAPVAALDEAYRLPDGTFAEICSEHLPQNQSQHGKHEGGAILFCEACLLASSILLPTPLGDDGLNPNPASLENALPQQQEAITLSELRTNRARGPPSSAF
ncbi:hypothetical protein [Agrobacterium cavarae]|uniref:hypothetical protein n=1 Tax=Agrobacterium cavarae TaxID=2528239 RepID=UPI002FFB262C